MTEAQLIKTGKTLSNHVARGNTLNGKRSQELVDRYNDLKADYIEKHGYNGWREFCKANNTCPTHDAYDFFA